MGKIKLILLLSVFMITCCVTTSQAKMPNYESRKYYAEMHSELSLEIKQAILKGKVIDGMTKQDVLATWGEPSRKSDYDEPEGLYGEDWYYDQHFYSFASRKFVRFGVDGIVNYVSERYK